ncbi:3-phosphoshikimate 1-carboxyvinyltransferase [Raoultella planticola]|uniref:3-phosphoshikimate 1-carboxyvinyltransferase n=1 Tax=Raoultella planticola TaxID=575 RepID=A0A485C8W9_RAOPL|nr:3-phosphoshikimate 1-carboxyvinyltransferase [Raoultella planticola]
MAIWLTLCARAGAQIDYLEQENYPPLRLRGGFTGGDVEVDGSVSSQFLTALLMAAPLAPQDTVIAIKGELVSRPYIDITLHLMKTFGVEVENQAYQRFIVRGNQQYQSPGDYLVEGDASSASYFLAAGAIKGGTVKVTVSAATACRAIFVLPMSWKKWGRPSPGEIILPVPAAS